MTRPGTRPTDRTVADAPDDQRSMETRSSGELAGMSIRPMRPADIDAGLRLCRATGWNQVARDWAQFLALEPQGARVAEWDGRVVGTVTTLRYGDRFGWIGMVLVDPAVRGRGLGTLLLDQAMLLLLDMPLMRLDATPAGHAIYLKRDFREEFRIRRLQATAPRGLVGPAGSRVRIMSASDLPDVIALDEQVFGARRAAMLHWMWGGAPDYAWIVRHAGTVAGYALGRHGHAFEHLGPIVASDEEAARLLAAAVLSDHPGRNFVIDAPLHTAGWLCALEDMGFREQRPFIRMSKGTGGVPGDPKRQFAVLGPEFG